MKKVKMIMIAMLCMLAFSVTADDNSTLQNLKETADTLVHNAKANLDTVVNTIDTSAVSKQIYNDVKGAVVGLASALKVGAEHVYEILVKQQVVYSIIYLIVFIIGLIVLRSWNKALKNKDEEWFDSFDDLNPIGISRIYHMIIGCVILLIGMFHIDTIVTGIINPEYGAIKEILNLIK